MIKEEQQVDEILLRLRDPATIRSQAQGILKLAKQDQLHHFTFNPEKMASTASFIVDVIIDQYPDMNIPYHSRWRHFEAGGVDRIRNMQKKLTGYSGEQLAIIFFELVIISVFLDAGAGPTWRYLDKDSGEVYSRSEGLALASLSLYQKGVFSNDPEEPLRVDAQRLLAFTPEELAQELQVSSANPIEGLGGRVALINRLGSLILQKSQFFGSNGRLGEFYTYVHSLKSGTSLSVATIFQAVLSGFNEIWPARLLYHGVSLGDVWTHSALKTNVPGSEYIPFHKLSQWLSYSLIEPLEQSGIDVTDLDQLTG